MLILMQKLNKVCMNTGFYLVSPELSSVRDYVITHSVHSMYVVRSMCMYICGNLQN